MREVYGKHYAETYPEVELLYDEIKHIFDARTKRTAQRRHEAILAQQELLVTPTPRAATIFDLLERHWPSRSTPSRATTSPPPTTPPRRSSASSPSITRPSVASRASRPHDSVQRSSRRSIASSPSNAFGADVLWNWPGMRYRSCRWYSYSEGLACRGPSGPCSQCVTFPSKQLTFV